MAGVGRDSVEVLHRSNNCVILDNLIYCGIPKAANTSIKLALLTACGRPAISPHKPVTFEEIGLAETLRRRRQGAFVFSVVRHPYTRFMSAWRDLIAGGRWYRVKGMRRFAARLTAIKTVEDFAGFVASVADDEADNHFKSQSALLTSEGTLVVEAVGKVENLAHDWPRLSALMQERCGIVVPALTQTHVSKRDDVVLPEGVKAVLARRYRDDLEMFGYEENATSSGGAG